MHQHRDVLVDAGLAVTMYGLQVALLTAIFPDPDAALELPFGLPIYVVGIATIVPLALRRRLPLTVMTVVVVAFVVQALILLQNTPVDIVAGLVAVYSAGRYGRPLARDVVRGFGAVTLISLVFLVHVVDDHPGVGSPLATMVLAMAVYGGAWVLGDQTRRNHERRVELEAANRALDLARRQAAHQAATAERLRIARELHDVLGHHISVMGVLASGARRALERGNDDARQAMETIETASRRAVADVQDALRLLREDDATTAANGAGGLAQLSRHVEQLRQAGVDVHVQIEDMPDLPASVELAAVRVVQEALTNILRHAGPGTTAWVRATVDVDRLEVVVVDDGRGKPEPPVPGGTGYGLAGLAERVELHGGRLDAGRHDPRGFRVAAMIPLNSGGDAVAGRSLDERKASSPSTDSIQ